jgi:predicted nuclease of predicted toxin-antitoxin system
MGGRPDASIADICRREDRVLLTLDMDFADIRLYPPQNYSGLLVLRLERQEKPRVVAAWERIIPLLEREPINAHLWIVEERTVRIRGAVGGAVKLKIS